MFYRGLQTRRSSIKQVLLAGDLVVGVGNIYAAEALFMAGIRPTVRADRLTKPRVARLHAAIVAVLQRAVALGGSTLRDFSSAEGQSGYFQLDAMVYAVSGVPNAREKPAPRSAIVLFLPPVPTALMGLLLPIPDHDGHPWWLCPVLY